MAAAINKRALAATLDQKRRFAALYVTGTDKTRGDWDGANKVLGTEFVPCDIDIRRMIEEEQGIPPLCESLPQPEALPDFTPLNKAKVATQEQEDEWRAKIKPEEDTSKAEWCEQWKLIKPTFDAAAKNEISVTASQVRVMLSVQERCYGKIGSKDADLVASGVLLLPTIGTGSTMHICPRCGYTEKAIDQN